MALPSSTTPSRIRTIGASGQEAKLRTFHSPPMRKTAPRRPASLQFDLHLRASKLRGQDENAERSSILTVDRGTTPRLVPLCVPWVKHQEPGRSVLRETLQRYQTPAANSPRVIPGQDDITTCPAPSGHDQHYRSNVEFWLLLLSKRKTLDDLRADRTTDRSSYNYSNY